MNFVGLEDQGRALLAQDRKIDTIKLVHSLTGGGCMSPKIT